MTRKARKIVERWHLETLNPLSRSSYEALVMAIDAALWRCTTCRTEYVPSPADPYPPRCSCDAEPAQSPHNPSPERG